MPGPAFRRRSASNDSLRLDGGLSEPIRLVGSFDNQYACLRLCNHHEHAQVPVNTRKRWCQYYSTYAHTTVGMDYGITSLDSTDSASSSGQNNGLSISHRSWPDRLYRLRERRHHQMFLLGF